MKAEGVHVVIVAGDVATASHARGISTCEWSAPACFALACSGDFEHAVKVEFGFELGCPGVERGIDSSVIAQV